MAQGRQVVISGLGMASPIGLGAEAFWQALLAGRSGVGPLAQFDTTNMPAGFGGEIKDFDPKQYVTPRKSLKMMCREIQIAFAAARLAMEDAGLERGAVDPERMGVIFGSEFFYADVNELINLYKYCIVDGKFRFERFAEGFRQEVYPLFLLKYLPNMPACQIGIAYDARGPCNSIALTEVSSLIALGECTRVIERGQADVMITGGTGSRLYLLSLIGRSYHNISHRGDVPQAASRPFDAGRDGLVNGEGAGALVLETQEHAQRRGAKILARVLGCANRFEPQPKSGSRTGTAIRAAIERALDEAGLKPTDVGHVNAHGLSTVEEDRVEARAIRDVLGDVPVTALKSYFGNLGSGSGAVEMAASVLSFAEGKVPHTLNYEQPDPECPVNVIRGEPYCTTKDVAVVLNQSETGQAAAAVIAGPE